jgi:cell division protein ZapA (FtsZ GTPase activity inhibitor)
MDKKTAFENIKKRFDTANEQKQTALKSLIIGSEYTEMRKEIDDLRSKIKTLEEGQNGNT